MGNVLPLADSCHSLLIKICKIERWQKFCAYICIVNSKTKLTPVYLMSGLSMGFGIEAVDMAASCRPKEGLTILESLDNIFPSFS